MEHEQDDASGERAARGAENELAFAQRKLEENYGKIYRRLDQWRGTLQAGQEVLVWRRPVPAVLLYVAVHWLFFYFATNNEGFLSQLSSLLFCGLVIDAIWRAATKDGQGLDPNNSRSDRRAVRGGRQREMSGVVSFERALLLTHEERTCQRLAPFEVVCLTVGSWWMWLDNLWLALRHWSVHDPLMFCVSLAVPGLVLAVIGKYIPTLAVLYILVVGAIVWPYIQYHDLLQKTADFFAAHFPVLIQKAEAWWQFMKTLFSRDEGALSEFSLVKGGDETQTMELLDDEFDRLIPQSGGEREESGEGGRGASSREEKEMAATRRAVRRVDPGMSVLQDSVLGMPADAFHDVEDSLASFGPGTGEFPSISNLDQSLSLPQFPPELVSPTAPHLATISESEEGVLAALDDSEEFEFNLDQTDVQTGLRHRSTSQREPRTQMTHPLAQYSTSAPIRPPLEEMEGELSGHRTPPPAYDVVVTESEYQYMYPKLEEELYQQKGVPKSSSTPLLYGQK